MSNALKPRYEVTRGAAITRSDVLPDDMPATAKQRLGLLGVVFYGHGTVKVTDERPDAGSLFLPDDL